MWIGDESFQELAELDPAGMREWIRRHEPEEESSYYWWGIASRAQLGLYESRGASYGAAFAQLAVIATEEAAEHGALSEHDAAIGIAYVIAVHLAGGGEAGPFDVDAVVGRCLDLIEVPFAVAAARAPHWRELPMPEIRALRSARNLTGPCDMLADRVSDPEIAERLARWLRLRADLP
ncbi:hypothetical protein [Actinoplanes sp. NPDC051851]|uniref:hypothetical protein n=1 Tax=Actinoplanes sp. NPDC051851 TaxID=3154753 RepID=UPI00341A7895